MGQISVQFDVAYGNGSAAGAFTIPPGSAAGWLVNIPTVAKFVNQDAPDGPTEAKVAIIKPGKLLKLVGKGLGDTDIDMLNGGDPAGPVYTTYCVTNGAQEYCHDSQFEGCVWKPIAGGTGAKLVCKEALGCFVDLGLTVLDTCTNLEWEKKSTTMGSGVDAVNPQDVDNLYTWAGRCTINTGMLCQSNAAAATTCAAQTGGAVGCAECGLGDGTCNVDPASGGAITTIRDWVNQVNAASFAGYTDWRLATSAGASCCGWFPTGEPPELESIVHIGAPGCGAGSPCIDPIFGPTILHLYWSASHNAATPDFAWFVSFGSGDVSSALKFGSLPVRAVRPRS